jgi:ribonucleotide monophosphatase NagD (HAD superfamily)
MNGAQFIATQRNRYWSSGSGPIVDIGFWIAGLEYCTGVEAEVIGKPSINSYLTVCRDTGIRVDNTVMVSDDVLSDLAGAKKAGLSTVHTTDYSVRTNATITLAPDLTVSNLSEFVKTICG